MSSRFMLHHLPASRDRAPFNDRIASAAQSRGCQWIEWATAASNTDARAFYDGLGADSSAKVHYILKAKHLINWRRVQKNC